jgi:hypothetical protein
MGLTELKRFIWQPFIVYNLYIDWVEITHGIVLKSIQYKNGLFNQLDLLVLGTVECNESNNSVEMLVKKHISHVWQLFLIAW